VLRKRLGPKGDEVTGEWRRLHKEKLYDLYSLTNIVPVIRSGRIMRWADYVARMGTRHVHTGVWWRDLRMRETTWKT
jgi:hypothetical protein